MLFKAFLIATLLICSLTSGFAQPRLSLGITGGLQIYPSHVQILPLLGGSIWVKANKLIFLSGEYLRYQGVDVYPVAPSGLLATRVHENSHTQRLTTSLHFKVKTYNASSIVLMGINHGQSWDKRGYQLYEDTFAGPPLFRGNAQDHLKRSVSFASLTALGQNKKLPFYLQTRYGFSFNKFFEESKSFWQVLAGVHLGIF